MKKMFDVFRVFALSLTLTLAAHAGSSYYPFAQNSGSGVGYVNDVQYTPTFNVGDLGFSYPATSASLPFGNGMIANFIMTVDTTAATGTYYVGTVPDADDIYVTIY